MLTFLILSWQYSGSACLKNNKNCPGLFQSPNLVGHATLLPSNSPECVILKGGITDTWVDDKTRLLIGAQETFWRHMLGNILAPTFSCFTDIITHIIKSCEFKFYVHWKLTQDSLHRKQCFLKQAKLNTSKESSQLSVEMFWKTPFSKNFTKIKSRCFTLGLSGHCLLDVCLEPSMSEVITSWNKKR